MEGMSPDQLYVYLIGVLVMLAVQAIKTKWPALDQAGVPLFLTVPVGVVMALLLWAARLAPEALDWRGAIGVGVLSVLPAVGAYGITQGVGKATDYVKGRKFDAEIQRTIGTPASSVAARPGYDPMGYGPARTGLDAGEALRRRQSPRPDDAGEVAGEGPRG